MRTLYDVLGLGRSASAAQVEAAYRAAVAELEHEVDTIRAKAVGEAWSVLGSATRRDAYDARLRQKEAGPVTLVVENKPFPWLPVVALAVLLVGCATYYKVQSQRTAAAQKAVEAVTAAATAIEQARLAEAAQSRIEQQALSERRRAEDHRAREIASARYESSHSSISRSYEPAPPTPEQLRERELARAKADQRQEENLARQRSYEQSVAMQRALAIPVARH
jgi:curved DNA-binding protein CbpA